MEYKSQASLLGLPLVHVATGSVVDGRFRRGVAKGWIAVGDITFGVLLSVGGVAVGGCAVGGVGFGLISLCGLAVGAYAIGGLALGGLALGGAALAIYAALGGLAVAGRYAIGGAAFAAHANDAAAQAYVASGPLHWGELLMDHAQWFIVLAIIPAFVAVYRNWKRGQER